MPPNLITSALTGSTFLTSLRPQIPDPTVNASGLQDGSIDVTHNGARYLNATLIAWLNDALRETVHRVGWLIEDWWALPAIVADPVYPLDQRWHSITAAFAYRYPLLPLPEPSQIYPATATGQPLWYGTHSRRGVLSIYMYPAPNIADPTPTLSGTITASALTLTVSSTTNFLSAGGYLQIDNEIMEFSSFNATTGVVTLTNRGSCGTTAASHTSAATVYHLSLWVKGYRTPTPVVAVTDPIEVPEALMAPIYTYVRLLVKQAEQDDQAEQLLDRRYENQVQAILRDPRWQQDLRDGLQQVRAYGAWPGGGLAPMGPFGTIVP